MKKTKSFKLFLENKQKNQSNDEFSCEQEKERWRDGGSEEIREVQRKEGREGGKERKRERRRSGGTLQPRPKHQQELIPWSAKEAPEMHHGWWDSLILGSDGMDVDWL